MAKPAGLKAVWYGDDFTGASDTLATWAQAGLAATLFLRAPTATQLQTVGPQDAIGIAGAARAMTPDAMRDELAPVAAFMADAVRTAGARVLHYKCCSTFDSAPHVGSIGVATRLLQQALARPFTAIVGGQPSLGRYCLFGQLFAAAGSEVHRIDRHPTMSRHPVTPMHEADLALHLSAQGLDDIAKLDLRAWEQDDAALDRQLDALADRPVLMDVARDAQLHAVGRQLWRRAETAPVLAVGASSVAQALIDHWRVARQRCRGGVSPANGPVLVWAGSLSPVTAAQIDAAVSYRHVTVDASRLVAGDAAYRQSMVEAIAPDLRAGRHVLVRTPPASDAVPALAEAGGQLLRELLQAAPVSRVGVAGGDTSSHAVQALAPWALTWQGSFGPGVALCRLRADAPPVDGLEVMLKGGQMGAPDLFERLISGQP